MQGTGVRIPGWGTKISHAVRCGQKNKQINSQNAKSKDQKIRRECIQDIQQALRGAPGRMGKIIKDRMQENYQRHMKINVSQSEGCRSTEGP